MLKKAILSYSGGLDSTMLLFTLLNQGYTVRCYSFFYGQKHQVELGCATRNILLLKDSFPEIYSQVSHRIIDLTDCFDESTSSLSAKNSMEIPKGDYTVESQKSTVVENRNIIFSSIIYGKALAWSKEDDSNVDIYLGIHADDHAVYPDCTEESRMAAELCFKISNWGSEKINYKAPFVGLTKGQLLVEGVRSIENLLGSPYISRVLKNTNSCYTPNEDGTPCRECGTCKGREDAFKYFRKSLDYKIYDPCLHL